MTGKEHPAVGIGGASGISSDLADTLPRYQATRLRGLCVMCRDMLRAAEGEAMAADEIAELCHELELRALIAEAMADGRPMPWDRPRGRDYDERCEQRP